MSELAHALVGSSAAAAPSSILDGVPSELAHRALPPIPHTLYQELWHLAFWQQVSLDWIHGLQTPHPPHASAGFPTRAQTAAEPWDLLRSRFLIGAGQAAVLANTSDALPRLIRCPSPPGHATRTMSVEDQLISLAAHNAYHLGRIVLLRQLLNLWPPPSGGFTW